MSWNKIENHLFEKYYVEGEDKKLCKLMEAHDKEIQDKAIDTFSDKLKEKCDSMIAEKWNNEVAPISWANAYADFKDDVDEIAEQMKEAGE